MSGIKPPKPLLISSDIDMSQEWQEWLEAYTNYVIASKVNTEVAQVQVANFKATIGRPGLKVINSMGLSDEDKNNLNRLKEVLTDRFSPTRNKTYERCQFHRMKQQPKEAFEDFLQKLQVQVTKCSYGLEEEEFVMDQIVLGIFSDNTRQKLWVEEALTFNKTLRICRAAERAERQINELQQEHFGDEAKICAIKKDEKFDCKRCGTKHGSRSCPAFDKSCNKCGKKGHFGLMCKSNSNMEKKRNFKKDVTKVRAFNYDSDEVSDSDVDQYTVGAINVKTDKVEDKWSAKLHVGNQVIKVKLDTGAQCNVLSLTDAKKLKVKVEKSSTKRIIVYNNTSIKVIGEAKVACESKQKTHIVIFKIVVEDVQPVLGRVMCEKMEFIARIYNINKNKLGFCNNFEYDIDIIDNPKFKIIPARRIPYALKDRVKDELNKMVQLGVIKSISEPTPSVSPMLVVQKGSKLRICMDPTELNKNIKRRHYPLKTVEEIAAKVENAKWFTKLDCIKGFWQIKVSKKSSTLLTFSTPWGRYCYLRLPFGISSAPEVFTECINRTLDGIQNCEIAMDDIFIFANTKQELELTTEKVMDKLAAAGFTLNKEKM